MNIDIERAANLIAAVQPEDGSDHPQYLLACRRAVESALNEEYPSRQARVQMILDRRRAFLAEYGWVDPRGRK